MWKKISVGVALGLILGINASQGADRITLTDGTTLEGEIQGMSRGIYDIRLATGGTRQVEASRVKQIAKVPDAVFPPRTVSTGNALRLHGSNTIGAELAPVLITRFLQDKGAHTGTWQVTGAEVERILDVEGAGGLPKQVEIHAHGSSTAFTDLGAGKTDIGMASRRIKIPKEVVELANLGDMLDSASEHVIGLDGVAVIIHPNNLIAALSTEQIASIFQCKISDWSQVGGTPGPITVYARDDKSGTFDTFKHLVLQDQPLGDKSGCVIKRFEDSEKLSDSVSGDPGGIGFIGLAYIRQAKPLGIQECSIAYSPSSFAVKTEEYPLARRLYMYTPSALRTPLIQEFTHFIQSSSGQSLVGDTGFVSLEIEDSSSPAAIAQSLARTRAAIAEMGKGGKLLNDLIATTQGAQRLSVTYRFETGKSTLDEKARADIARLADYLRQPENQGHQLLLLGFADSAGGNYQSNLHLSEDRARAVDRELRKQGIEAAVVKGFGEEAPVACNTSDQGKWKNRHVEAWLR